MLTVLGITLFALGILASIALHEVGHLVPAKRSGVKVTQYMVGFGPTLWSTRRGETEYGLKWIPLGGYIRMIGMYPPARGADPTRPLQLRRSSTGPFSQLAEDARTASLEEIAPGDEKRTFYRLPVRRKLLVMLGGPVMNLLIATVLFTLTLSVLGTPSVSTQVAKVPSCVATGPECAPGDPAGPAAAAGVRPGDRIVAFDGQPVASWLDLSRRIRAAGDRVVSVTVERDGSRLELPVDLVVTERRDLDDPQRLVQVGVMGVSPTPVLERQPLTVVPGAMADLTLRAAEGVIALPQRMVGIWQAAFSGQQRDLEGPIGVVGVSRLGGEVVALEDEPVSYKVYYFLNLLAGLNLALFVFNMLPLLPLDGGHVAGALWEGARRQFARLRGLPDPGPVDVARMLPLAYAVAIMLIGMSALLLYADLVNPVHLPG